MIKLTYLTFSCLVGDFYITRVVKFLLILRTIFGKKRPINSRDNIQCIFIINFAKHGIWEIHSVHFPIGMTLSIVIKVFIVRFQNPVIGVIFLHLISVFSVENPILIRDKKARAAFGCRPSSAKTAPISVYIFGN
jgi:hypothetical protein